MNLAKIELQFREMQHSIRLSGVTSSEKKPRIFLVNKTCTRPTPKTYHFKSIKHRHAYSTPNGPYRPYRGLQLINWNIEL